MNERFLKTIAGKILIELKLIYLANTPKCQMVQKPVMRLWNYGYPSWVGIWYYFLSKK